ncbi:MAG: hypothetical protein DRI61_08125, partial [Chloroflexi bacterium]
GEEPWPDFFILDEETAREAALAGVWVPWGSATPQERRNMAHIVLKAVPVDVESGTIDFDGITLSVSSLRIVAMHPALNFPLLRCWKP